MSAFQGCSNPKSTVTLIDMDELELVEERAFYNYKGSVLMRGRMPLLESIGVEAFALVPTEENRIFKPQGFSTVEVKDLPLLKRVGEHAFDHFKDGNFAFEGTFPRLESIGTSAFANIKGSGSVRSFKLLTGAAALQCIGPGAFANTSWGIGSPRLSGGYPCLMLVDATATATATRTAYNVATYNVFENIVRNATLGFLGEFRMIGNHGICNSIQGFAHPAHCAHANR